jgi:hypothetical protein
VNTDSTSTAARARGAGPRSTLDVALDLASQGFAVLAAHGVIASPSGVACGCGNQECRALGKAPFESFTTWLPDLPLTHPREVRGRWNAAAVRMSRAGVAYVEPNIGIATGDPWGYVVLDIDAKADGYRTLFELEQNYGELPKTVSAVTGGGGRHLYFKEVRPLKGGPAGMLGSGVDVKAHHGYVIAPGSLHKSGARYQWVPGYSPREVEMAVLPELWFERIHKLAHAGPSTTARGSSNAPAMKSRFDLGTAKKIAVELVTSAPWRWAAENPDEIGRSTWLALASNLAAAIDGHQQLIEPARREFRTLSEGYTGYCVRDADRVFDGALAFIARGGGPARWEQMIDVPAGLRGDSSCLVEDTRRLVFTRWR